MGNSKRMVAVVTILAALLLIGGLFWAGGKKPQSTQSYRQEFGKLNVVQFYLHMQRRDYIIGRDNPNFNKVMAVASKAVLAISKPLPEIGIFPDQTSPGKTVETKSIQDIESGAVCLSIWLIEPQKISTRIRGNGTTLQDKYGNAVVETDRVLLVLGGKFMGKVFTRDYQTGQWRVWTADSDGFMPLIEAVRAGGL